MLSIIIPFHDEEQNINNLYNELKRVLSELDYEVIFIDDGSEDQGAAIAQKLCREDKKTHLIRFAKRQGKGQALFSGAKKALGDTLVFMDADLQDDPQDIPKFIQKIEEGYDLVNGARTDRKDNFLIKIYSNIFNVFLKILLQSPFADINCGFKALKKNILDEIVLYGNNFRFLPLAAFYNGYKTAEIKVNNRARQYGSSKYGISKLFIGLIDFITAYFLYKFSEKPLHFFGLIGGSLFLTGFIMALYLSIERLFFGVLLYQRPILQFAILLIIVGIQIVMTGIIGELIVYINKKKR